MSDPCKTPLDLAELLAYRRQELPAEREAAVEDHYFECAHCAGRLSWLERLEGEISAAIRLGHIDLVVTRRSIDRLERSGAILRRYDIEAGGSVNCTVAPDDELSVVTLHTALRPGVPLTLVSEMFDPATQGPQRMQSPVFQDPQSGEVVLAFASEPLRALGHVRVDITVYAGEAADGEALGRFQLNHSPWGG